MVVICGKGGGVEGRGYSLAIALHDQLSNEGKVFYPFFLCRRVEVDLAGYVDL